MPMTWGRQPTKPCDSNITSPALLFCQVCEQSPAVVTCKADNAALCSACDHHIHSANPLAHRHERLPVVPPFFQLTPSDPAADISEPTSDDSWLIPNNQKKIDDTGFLFSPDFDPFLDSGSTDFDMNKQVMMDELCNHGSLADSVVPIQPLDDFSNERCFEIDFTKSKLSPFHFPAHSITQTVSSSDVGIVPDANTNSISEVTNFSFSNSTSGKESSTIEGGSTVQLSRNDRKARVLRYREKKKNRRFEKTIRYASRKAYAEIRPRIKGRFAKRTHVDADAGGVVGSFILDDDMYGVVPSL